MFIGIFRTNMISRENEELNKSSKIHLLHQHVITLEIDDVNEKKNKKKLRIFKQTTT